jgi:hypothetical protein
MQNALWTYSLDTKEWRKIETNIASDSMDVDNEGPKARFAHQFVYDPLRCEHYVSRVESFHYHCAELTRMS